MNIKIIALTAVLGAAAGANALVFTGLATSVDGVGFGHNKLLGTIEAKAGFRIELLTLGIGGDADVASGKMVFSATGGGLDFVWAAGQDQLPSFPITYMLNPTAETGIHGRSFSYKDVSLVAAANQPLNIYWRGTADWDGNYTMDVDRMGTSFNDSALPASGRAWVQYQYQAVPEPASMAALGLGLIALIRRKKS